MVAVAAGAHCQNEIRTRDPQHRGSITLPDASDFISRSSVRVPFTCGDGGGCIGGGSHGGRCGGRDGGQIVKQCEAAQIWLVRGSISRLTVVWGVP